MPESVWMSNGDAKAYVPKGEVDTWKPRGWSESDEPAGDEFVWLHNEQIDGRARFPAGVLDQWEPRGWAPSTPPEPVSPLRDPVLSDVQPQKAAAKKTAGKTESKDKE